MERCMEMLLMKKMEALKIAEDCISHQSEQASDFREIAQDAHELYKKMDRLLHKWKKEHEAHDAEMDKRYSSHDRSMHRMYHDHHKKRADEIARKIAGR